MKRLRQCAILLLCLCFFATDVAFGEESSASSSDSLDALVDQALAGNPEIKASEARWQAFTQRVKQAGVFEDPMLMLKVQNALVRDPLNFRRDVMTAKVIGVSQMLPFFGKRALERQGAERAAESERWNLEERRLEVRCAEGTLADRSTAPDYCGTGTVTTPTGSPRGPRHGR